MIQRTITNCLATALLWSGIGFLQAEVKMPGIFSDNMVLQAGISDPVWGWDTPAGKITVTINGQVKSVTAGADGKWMLKLDPMTAGGPYEMTVAGSSQLTVKNILVGENWLCSGQSNMQMPCMLVPNRGAENFPKIRLFYVPNRALGEDSYTFFGRNDQDIGKWVICNDHNVQNFSAVAFFFGRKLHKELNVPVGLIESSWSGSPVEPWISRPSLDANPDFAPVVQSIGEATDKFNQGMIVYKAAMDKFESEKGVEPGSQKDDQGWESASFNDSSWQSMKLPAMYHVTQRLWLRKPVEIPSTWVGKDILLSLGTVYNDDVTYVNGVQVGATERSNLANEFVVRKYTIPAALVKDQHLLIALRIDNTNTGGGVAGKPEAMFLQSKDAGGETVSLAGDWKSAPVCTYFQPPRYKPNPFVPSCLYESMISPLVPFGIKGVIWYQGEANIDDPYLYRSLFRAMIADWRKNWNEGEFPFYYVQLANLTKALPEPDESDWAELREAQLMTLKTPNTGMAVAVDIGSADTIHPPDKLDVGLRLANWALAKTYGKNIVYSGPLYKSSAIEGKSIRIKFDCVGGGLVSKDGGPLKQFAIAGEDKKFVWADAKIDNDSVVVSSDAIATPVAVRYAWATNPEGCNLFNKDGLPASPFRTDDWPSLFPRAAKPTTNTAPAAMTNAAPVSPASRPKTP